uniref:Arginine and glutamate rich 1b n=1 Tax=Lepisosteus oculatus TaxID=7918 RepID=W5MZ23_LEPOC
MKLSVRCSGGWRRPNASWRNSCSRSWSDSGKLSSQHRRLESNTRGSWRVWQPRSTLSLCRTLDKTEEERAKREELEKILEENNRKIADAQAKLAEEQLKIVEEQRKIHEERMKLEQERQRQQKEEQKLILGKGKSRPKLSFSLKPTE